jgi:hypothetical protein
LSTSNAICEQLAECYPDLQTPGEASCNAAPSGDLRIVYPNPAADETTTNIVTKCLHGYPDQAAVAAWIRCHIDASQVIISCFAACPADGLMCTNAGNDAVAQCTELIDQDALQACFKANQ